MKPNETKNQTVDIFSYFRNNYFYEFILPSIENTQINCNYVYVIDFTLCKVKDKNFPKNHNNEL